MFFPSILGFASILTACCLATSTLGATLAKIEVEALESIGKTLGKTNWNFGIDPCSGDQSWQENTTSKYYTNYVTCDCTFKDNTTCHVVMIELKGQNLSVT